MSIYFAFHCELVFVFFLKENQLGMPFLLSIEKSLEINTKSCIFFLLTIFVVIPFFVGSYARIVVFSCGKFVELLNYSGEQFELFYCHY